MSSMTESLLLKAQSLRVDGELNASIDLLQIVLSQCKSDIQSTNHNNESLGTIYRIHQMAAYQLALQLLQRSGRSTFKYQSTGSDSDPETDLVDRDETEADGLLWKLGYRMRLSRDAFGYPVCCCHCSRNIDIQKLSELRVLVIDDALPSSIFEALQNALKPSSRYWTQFYSKIAQKSKHIDNECVNGTIHHNQNRFASHNIKISPLSKQTSENSDSSGQLSNLLQTSNSLLEQVAIIVRYRLQARFPELKKATSVEVWCHRRDTDGFHQLHYDMDEIRLYDKKKKFAKEIHDSTAIDQSGAGVTRHMTYEPSENDGTKFKKTRMSHLTKDMCKKRGDNDVSCPMVSCVLTVFVPNSTDECPDCGNSENGAPTLVCNQSILNLEQTISVENDIHTKSQTSSAANVGWLCYPKPNRLLAFKGSLLHGVIPGIPAIGFTNFSTDEDDTDYYDTQSAKATGKNEKIKRVTFMLGFWSDDVCLTPIDNCGTEDPASLKVGPNMPFPLVSPEKRKRKRSKTSSCFWVEEFYPQHVDGRALLTEIEVNDIVQSTTMIQVNPLWVPIKGERDFFNTFIKGNRPNNFQFKGRFFLKSLSTSEINNEVLFEMNG